MRLYFESCVADGGFKAGFSRLCLYGSCSVSGWFSKSSWRFLGWVANWLPSQFRTKSNVANSRDALFFDVYESG